MSLVYTTEGDIDSSNLVVKDIVTLEDNARVIATEWYLGDKLVRRDVWVSVLRAQNINSEQGRLG